MASEHPQSDGTDSDDEWTRFCRGVATEVLAQRNTHGTAKSVAAAANISSPYLGDLTAGKNLPSVAVLDRLLRVFHLRMSTFFSGVELRMQDLQRDRPAIMDAVPPTMVDVERIQRAIGQEIACLRKGRTQRAIGELAGISHAHVSQVERSTAEPSLEVLYKLAKVFGLTMSGLFSGVETRMALLHTEGVTPEALLGLRIKARMAQDGLTVEQLATRAGVQRRVIESMLRGGDSQVYFVIAKALGTTMEQLCAGLQPVAETSGDTDMYVI